MNRHSLGYSVAIKAGFGVDLIALGAPCIDIRVENIHRCCLVNALHKNPGGRVYYLIQCKKIVRIFLMLICYLTAIFLDSLIYFSFI